MTIRQLQNDIAAALYIKPMTFDELMACDFLHGKSHDGIWLYIQILIRRKWVFEDKQGRLRTYKSIARHKLSRYELC